MALPTALSLFAALLEPFPPDLANSSSKDQRTNASFYEQAIWLVNKKMSD